MTIQSIANAVVDAHFHGEEGQLSSGTRTYRTIQKALQEAPSSSTEPYIVLIKSGRYYEKLDVNKPNITFIGEGEEQTILTYDAAAGMDKPEGGKYGTTGSASITVQAPKFRAFRLTIENSFDYRTNKAKSNDDPSKIQGSQGVALKTAAGSDQAVFERVRFIGCQDTLYADAGTQYYKDCFIEGNVDFIFGGGQAVFDNCEIVSLDRGRPEDNGFVTAPSTMIHEQYGFLFVNCRLKKEHPEMADQSVALGRPWHPGGNPDAVGSAVFIHCEMDSHISARGWVPMSAPDGQGGKLWFYPEDSRFFEFASTGPGSHSSSTRRELSEAEAETYTMDKVLKGWVPMLL